MTQWSFGYLIYKEYLNKEQFKYKHQISTLIKRLESNENGN